jgi:hypothetical protein
LTKSSTKTRERAGETQDRPEFPGTKAFLSGSASRSSDATPIAIPLIILAGIDAELLAIAIEMRIEPDSNAIPSP